jgi:hypothetical protein
VGIRIGDLEEGCCDYLNDLSPVKGDSLDQQRKTVDNIVECDDKYILIEEKSFILDFYRQACVGRKKFSHFINDGILIDDFFVFLGGINKKEKREIFKKSALDLLEAMPKKIETTLTYLSDKVKISNSSNVILYCKSETEVDKIASIVFAKYNNEEENTVIECQKLERYLQTKGCI